MNHFQCFMGKGYTIYSRSVQNQRQLAECAQELHQELTKIGCILDTRWVASSFRPVATVWNNIQAMSAHFYQGMSSGSKTHNGRKMYAEKTPLQAVHPRIGHYVHRPKLIGSSLQVPTGVQHLHCIPRQAHQEKHTIPWTNERITRYRNSLGQHSCSQR